MYVFDYSNTPVNGLEEQYRLGGVSYPCDGDRRKVTEEAE